MSRVARYTKKPAEVQDYVLNFSDYLEYHNDLAASVSIVAAVGITVDSHELVDSVVRVFLSGGTNGKSYKVSAILTTQGGRVKQGDMLIRIKT